MATINTKKENAAKNITKKETAKKDLSILESLKNQLKNVDTEKKVSNRKDKQLMYIYPENLKGLPTNDVKCRNFRNKRRNVMQSFSNEISIKAAIFQKSNFKDAEILKELKTVIEDFKKEYKEFYFINDFKPESVTQKTEKIKQFSLMFQIINNINNLK